MLDEVVKKYIAARDQKAVLKAKYDGDVAKIDGVLEKCERFFLKTMNEQGLQSLPTKDGVPYKQTQVTNGVEDWEQTIKFIREQEAWHLLEHRVNKTAVEQYVAEHQELPPGVKRSERIVVNVRRA